MKTKGLFRMLSAALTCAILAMFIPAAMAAETVVYTQTSLALSRRFF